VSTTHVLGISGLLLPRLFADLAVVEEKEEGFEEDEFWDPPLTDDDIACLDITSDSSTIIPQSLAQSFMEQGGSHATPESLKSLCSSALPADPSPASGSSSTKGKQKSPDGKFPPMLCKICYEEYSNESDLYWLTNCDHIYCHECINGYLTLQITSGGVLDLGCPHPECEAEINIGDIAAICDAATVEKYEKFVVLSALRADPNVRWCPMPQCSSPVKGPPAEGSEWITCGTCQLQVCFACGDERHDPAQCGKEARELIATRHNVVVEAERAFEEWHQGKPTDVKPCPRCKAYIEKNQGCNHMTCIACKHQFCWLCSAEYTYNHFNSDDYPTCRGKQYWYPPVPVDPELQQRYNWIYFPPNYQYEGVESGPLRPNEPGYVAPVRSNAQRARKVAKKVGVYVGVGMAVATLGIPAAIIGGPIYGVFRLHKRLKAQRRNRNSNISSLV